MMKNLTAIPTLGMSREAWLEERRKSIGGSDAAGIMGLTPWSSPYSVWADKTGRLPDKPDTEAMRLGRDLEEYVAQRWCEATGKKVRRRNAILRNPLYPFAHADVDRMVVGEDAGLECKTTSDLDVKKFKGVEFPEKYYAQCVHYMAVTGAQRWYLAVLVFGRGFFTYILDRDQAEIDALMGQEERFWRHVVTDTPPETDGTNPTTEALQAIYEGGISDTMDLYGFRGCLQTYMELKEQKKLLDEQIASVENQIKATLQDTEKGVCGDFSVSWKRQNRRSFDADSFRSDHPEIDMEDYYKVSTARVFRVTKKKGE